MLVYHRATGQQHFPTSGTSYLFVVNVARPFNQLAGSSEPDMALGRSSPSPFFRADLVLGDSTAPGAYIPFLCPPESIHRRVEYFRGIPDLLSAQRKWATVRATIPYRKQH